MLLPLVQYMPGPLSTGCGQPVPGPRVDLTVTAQQRAAHEEKDKAYQFIVQFQRGTLDEAGS